MNRALLLPSLDTVAARLSYWLVVFLRSLFFVLFIFSLDRILMLGTSPTLISAGSVLGVLVASRLAFSELTHRGFLTLLVLGYLAYRLLLLPLGLFSYLGPVRTFFGFDLSLHLAITLGACAIAAALTWAFWKFRHALTFEIVVLAGAAVYFFSGHRNFHFDTPQIIQRLAWLLKIEQLSALIFIGSLLVVAILGYAFFATLPGKPTAVTNAPAVRANLSRPHLVFGGLLLVLLAAILYVITSYIYSYYSQAAATRATNGVGEASKEGTTPLGFHSALGSTNQPAALVRLEGDYKENPFSPMLYLRESALSYFNGHELTIANRSFDQDVSLSAPGEAFTKDEDVELLSRVPLVQSIYLLSDHKLAFAVDYPLSIVGLKNPNPSRFKATYRAYSVAPGFSLQTMGDSSVGDPRWTPAVRNHYLVPHPDHRYADLALQITAGVDNPVERASTIVQYLSKNAIYTLTPNHTVGADDDPVAPFLFGDMRGYCVHFAHATVYMFRALGIPARIGTGYLTDLSQSKDGHILLRMSDRHAWAEAYIDGHGWIPFDTQPEQVENHADTQVDMKVLDELMGLLGPGEEILPKETETGESGLAEPDCYELPEGRMIAILALALIALLVSIKAYLRFGWMLPGGPAFKLQRSYISLLSFLHDLGYRREFGETRAEFRKRLTRELGIRTLTIADPHQAFAYALDGDKRVPLDLINAARIEDFKRLTAVERWRRIIAALSPSSTFATILGARW